MGISAGAGAAIAAGVGGAAALGSGLMSSNASQSAAKTQAAAANNAAAETAAQYAQTQENLFPYMQAGMEGRNDLLTTLGLPSPGGSNILAANGVNGLTYQSPSQFSSVLNNPTFAPTQAQLAATPGYQFDLAQGLQSTQNANAAQGLGISGAALKGAAQYATGLANNTLSTQAGIFQNNYNNALQGNQQGQGIFQTNLSNVLTPLTNLTNMGENSAALVGQQGVATTSNEAQLQVGGANALASGTVGSANAMSNALSQAGNAPLNYMMYNSLLNGAGAGEPVDTGSFDIASTGGWDL